MAAAAKHFRETIQSLLESSEWIAARCSLNTLPASSLANALPAFLCSAEDRVRWRAVQAMGDALCRLARVDMEAARRVLRRLLWSLNDESGGIGWGAAEAMGEAAARHEGIAREFGPIIMALLREDGYHIQFAPVAMQRAALWSVCRASGIYPQFLSDQAGFLLEYLNSADAAVRALAARALGLLRARDAISKLSALFEDAKEIQISQPAGPEHTSVCNEARRALLLINESK